MLCGRGLWRLQRLWWVEPLASRSEGPKTGARAPLTTGRSLARAQPEINIVSSANQDLIIPNNLNVADLVWQNWERWPDRTAVVCGITGRGYSYKEARELSGRLAAGLLGAGCRPGQVLASFLPNTPEYPIAILGVLEAGLVLSTINATYTAEEVLNQLKDSASVGIITIPERLEVVLEAQKRLHEHNPQQAKNFQIFVTQNLAGKDVNLPAGVISLTGLAKVKSKTIPKSSSFNGENLAILPYSSGTTGLPKGVCLTHKNVISIMLQVAHPSMRQILETTADYQEVIPAVLPIYHLYALVGVALQGLLNGAKIVTLPKFEEKSFLNVLKDQKATVLYVAPPLLVYLGTSPNVTKDHLKTLRLTMSGAAPAGASDMEKCFDKSPKGNRFKQGFGLTEALIVCCHQLEVVDYSSVGPVVPNTEVKIVDPATGKSLPANQSGEICVRGPQVMKSYLNNPKATEDTLRNGWLHTGDVAYYDENNNFYIVDRMKELIKVKGFQVAPSELEAVLRSRRDVLDVGVIGVPNKRKGEAPVAYIVVKPNNKKPTQEELTEFLKKKVANHKLVEEYIFCDSIPKSPAGKILRKELKEIYKSKKSG